MAFVSKQRIPSEVIPMHADSYYPSVDNAQLLVASVSLPTVRM